MYLRRAMGMYMSCWLCVLDVFVRFDVMYLNLMNAFMFVTYLELVVTHIITCCVFRLFVAKLESSVVHSNLCCVLKAVCCAFQLFGVHFALSVVYFYGLMCM